MLRRAPLSFLLALSLAAAGCTCGDKAGEATVPPGAAGRTLTPLPAAPALAVPPEAPLGAGEGLTVVAARPQGEQVGEVRPTVTFSRPVKSLEMVEAQRAAGAAQPFARIEPKLEGEWRWLGSSSVEFVPSGLVPYSTAFTVTVLKRLTALDGASLKEDSVFSFTTPRLELQDVRPLRNDRWVTPEATITLLFNQPVAAADLEAGTRFTVNGAPVRLKVIKEVSIQEERRAQALEERRAGRSFEPLPDERRGFRNRQVRYTLQPTSKLPLRAVLTLDFDPSLHGVQGPLPMTAAEPINWTTYGPMQVQSVQLCNGESRCPHGPLVLTTTNLADVASLKDRLVITPPVELDWESASASVPDSDWELREGRVPTITVPGNFKPGTKYAVGVAPGVLDVFKQASTAQTGAPLTTDDLSAALVTGGPLGLLEATDRTPRLPIEVSNLSRLQLRLWKLSLPEVARALARPAWEERALVSRAPDFVGVEALAYPRNVARVHPLELSKVLGPEAKTGLALVSVNSPDLEHPPREGYQQVVQVTDLAAHLKLGPTSSLAWVTRLSTGEPVAGAQVLVLDETGAQVWEGTTNAEGFADIPGAAALKLKSPANRWEFPYALVAAQKDGDVGVTADTWASGVEPWEFGLSQGWEGEQPESAAFLFTDRGIYRPGDEVFVKGVVRYRVLGQLQVPPENSSLKLKVSDSRDQAVLDQAVKLTRFGTFSAKVTIPKDAPTGYFSASATGSLAGGEVSLSGGFRVEEYRAPQFRVDVEVARQDLVAGDPLEATVSARYLFGGPMSEAQVKWSVQRSSTRFSSEAAPDFTFALETWWWDDGAPAEGSGFFGSGEGRADGKGALAVKAGTTEAPAEKPWLYTLEAEVTDVNRQAVADRATVTVHPSSRYVGLRSSTSFLEVGKQYPLDTVVVDPKGARAAGASVAVTVTSRTWKSVKKKDASGGWTTISEPEEKQVHACTLTSVDTGSVPCPFTPAAAGFYIVRAQVKDAQGRSHSSSLGIYATGSDWVAWQRGDTDRVELLTDKTSYDVGDVAKVLIKSPYPQAKALVTVEREGVLSRRLVDLKGSVVTVEVPITEDMVPNVFAGVLIMRPRLAEGGIESGDDPGRPNARIGLVKLMVEKKAKRLQVAVTTDKKEYRPRDTVQVAVDVKDAAGKPADGEVTLYVVDEAVLRLTAYEVPDPLAFIFPERPLSVRLGEPLLHLVRLRSYGEKGEAQGGGGGQGEGAGFRNQFKTTALWSPTLALEGGVAKTSFALPDNLTTFRLMAVVVTKADRFGSGSASLQVNKPVMALPALPRFARVNDTFQAGVVVHSHGAAGEATVTAQVEGGAQLTGPAELKVPLAEGAPREVRFGFKGTRAGPARFRFKVTAGAESDGVEHTLPVELPIEVDAVATSGDTTDQRVEGLTPPKDVWEDVGGLTVTLASTSLSGFDRGFQQLVEYPYGCLEQQSSRLVPFIALRELAGQFAIPWPGPDPKKLKVDSAFTALLRTWLFSPLDLAEERDPDAVITATVRSILALQDGDGSFRYWPDSVCADSWSSAWAALALSRAKEVGFSVPAEPLGRAQRYLERVVGGSCHRCERGCGDSERVLAAYVLARMHHPKASSYGEFYARRASLPLFERTLLANAMHLGGGDPKQARALLQEVLNQTKESPRGLSVEEVDTRTYATRWGSDTRTTGALLQALTDLQPDHPAVGKLAHYLTSVRQGNGQWRSTQEAAWSLMGLTEVVRTREKETPDFAASVVLGTTSLAQQDFRGRSLEVKTKNIPMKDLLASAGEPKLTFSKKGPGVLSYSALLRYAPKTLPTTSLDNGLFVQRWFEPWEGGGQALAVSAGDLVRVRLRVATNQQRHWVAFEVPLPAGLEPIDTSLATSARLPGAPGEESRGTETDAEGEEDGESGSADPDADGPWASRFWSPFNHVELRDSRVLVFADHLPPGVHVVSFVARATTPGTFVLKPARGALMYEPEVWGRSEGGSFEVLVPTPVSQK